ncbi:glycosyl transferase [Faustovirus]|nr:glycosyl transferase [Faustovirus]
MQHQQPTQPYMSGEVNERMPRGLSQIPPTQPTQMSLAQNYRGPTQQAHQQAPQFTPRANTGDIDHTTRQFNNMNIAPRGKSQYAKQQRYRDGAKQKRHNKVKPYYNRQTQPNHVKPVEQQPETTDTSSVKSLSPRATIDGSSGDWATIMDAVATRGANKFIVYIIVPISHNDGPIEERKSIGFDSDAKVLKKGLKHDRIQVHVLYADKNKSTASILEGKPKHGDLSIFIQQVNMYDMLNIAKQNWILCNHEVFLHSATTTQLNKLRKIDAVICKTEIGIQWVRECKEKYSLTYKIFYTSFTSPFKAIHPDKCPRQRDLVVHTAGQHHWKQTGAVIDCWYRHPDLPKIVITCFEPVIDEMKENNWVDKNAIEAALTGKIPNMILYTKKIPYNELVELKSKAGVHICCSFTEGWGHTINESRICGAITITTDAAPMNELIRPDCGILISPCKTSAKKNGTVINHINSEDIYEAMQVYLKLTDKQRTILGRNGHVRYLNDQYYYELEMKKIVNYIVSGFDASACPKVY